MLYTLPVSCCTEVDIIKCKVYISEVLSEDIARFRPETFTDNVPLRVSWSARHWLHDTHLENTVQVNYKQCR